MSLAQFVQGMSETLPTGMDLSEQVTKRRQQGAQQEIMSILGELENDNPFEGSFDPSTEALPSAPGQSTRGPNQGFDGSNFAALQKRYWKAMGRLNDLDQFAKAKEAFGTVRRDKINENLDAALAAYDRGDMAGAAKMMQGVSAYVSPGVTPEITIDPKSGAFVVANYKDGEPIGGMALTRDQIVDFRSRNTDWNAWADREQRDEEADRTYALDLDKLAHGKKMDEARLRLSQDADKRAADLQAVQIANAKLQQRTYASQAEVAEQTQDATIAATNQKSFADAAKSRAEMERLPAETERAIAEDKAAVEALPSATAADIATNKATVAAQTEEERKALDARAVAAMDFVDKMTTYNKTEAEELRASQGSASGSDLIEYIKANTTGEASSYDTLFGNSEQPGQPFAGKRVTEMTLGEALKFADPSGPYGKWVQSQTGGDVATPMGRYQIVGSTMAQAARELGISLDTRLTPEIQDQLAAKVYQMQGPGAWVAWGAGPGAGTVPRPGASGAPSTAQAAIPEGNAADEFMRAVTEDSGGTKKAEDEYRRDPWFYELPNANGEQYLKAGLSGLMIDTAREITKLNPGAQPEEIGLAVFDTFGPKGGVKITGDPDDVSTAVLSNGVSRFQISGDLAYQIDQYQNDVAQARMNISPDYLTQPTLQARAPRPAAPEPAAPEPQVTPEAAPAAPAPAPSPSPAGWNVPGGPAGLGLSLAAPSPVEAAIPEAPTPTINPRTVPGAPPRPVDDTSVPAMQGAPQSTAGLQTVPQVINSLPQGPAIIAAIQEWQRAGGAPQGQAFMQLQSIIGQVPEQVRMQVVQEIQQLLASQQGGRG